MRTSLLRAGLLAGILAVTGGSALGADAHPKYTLNGWVNNDSAYKNAKYWNDESGNPGVDGATPDSNGDYYSGNVRLDTPSGTFHFNVHSLNLGEIGGKGAQAYCMAANNNTVFGVLGDGLFLNKGFLGIQWLPFNIGDTITVNSPDSDPFKMYSAYGYPETHEYADRMHGEFGATFKSAFGTELWLYHAGTSNASGSLNTTYLFTFCGDYSGFLGTLRVGKDDEAGGRVTKVEFTNGAFPGTLKLTKSALLSLGTADLEAANLTLSDGASVVTTGGALVVKGTVSQAGAVNVKVVAEFPNVEFPKVSLLTVVDGAEVDESKFVVTCDGVAGVSVGWTDNGDGTKTLVATMTRPSCYVSETGDDSAAGDADHPFATLSNAVAKVTDGVIYVLPGTYDKGLCDIDDGQGAVATVQSRVHVPAKVLLKSTDGAEKTVIVGAPPTAGGDYGAGSTRCVRLDAGAVVQGFTLTGGYADAAHTGENFPNRCGGAAHGAESSVVMDCIITNNVAYWGGAIYIGKYVRCYFDGNRALSGGKDAFARPNLKTRVFNSIFATAAWAATPTYQYVEAYNCTFSGAGYVTPSTGCKLYNCAFYNPYDNYLLAGADNTYKNCIYCYTPSAFTSGSAVDCKAVGKIEKAFDASGYPLCHGAKYAVDAGDLAAYRAQYPSDVAEDLDFAGNPRVFGATIDIGAYEWTGRDWFVKPNGDDSADGRTTNTAFRTLAKAVSVATQGETVWALPGVYAEGFSETDTTKTRSRVRVPSYVTLRSTEGPFATKIVGATPTAGGDHGEGAARCVKLDPFATVVGFTLTGGHTYSGNKDGPWEEAAGGGVRGNEGTAAIDCRFYENTAARGGGGHVGAYVRCWYGTNVATVANWSGPDMFGINVWKTAGGDVRTYCFDCHFSADIVAYNHLMHSARAYNCTFTSKLYGGPSDGVSCYNCILCCQEETIPSAANVYDHCVLGATPKSFTTGSMTDCIVTNLADALAADGRLVANCAAVDFGVYEAYLAAWDEAGISRDYLGRDLAGGQRVYNAKIDVGSSEYDWRGAFGKAIGHRATVTAADPNVTLTNGKVTLHDGEALSFDCRMSSAGNTLDLVLSGSGTATVTLDGESLAVLTESGRIVFESAAESARVEIAYAGEGTATVQKLVGNQGALLIVR